MTRVSTADNDDSHAERPAVDGDADFVESIAAFVESSGHGVAVATTGAGALENRGREHADCLFLDLRFDPDVLPAVIDGTLSRR